MQQSPRYRFADMLEDAAKRGWLPIDLIRAGNVSINNGYRFLRGQNNSPRTAEKLTRALGKRQGYYLRSREEASA